MEIGIQGYREKIECKVYKFLPKFLYIMVKSPYDFWQGFIYHGVLGFQLRSSILPSAFQLKASGRNYSALLINRENWL